MIGCETIKYIHTGCTWTGTITASAKDTKGTKRQILVHDLTRSERCK